MHSRNIMCLLGVTILNYYIDYIFFFPCPAPPRFVSRLESSCVIEGDDVQFSCSTLTTPLPRIRYINKDIARDLYIVVVYGNWIFVVLRWFKDGREITEGQKYNIQNDTRSGILCLTVIGATKEDIGQYECEVRIT